MTTSIPIDIFKRRAGLVVGTGDSVNQYSVEQYKKYITFGLNYSLRIHDFYTFYFCEENYAIQKLSDEIKTYATHSSVWLREDKKKWCDSDKIGYYQRHVDYSGRFQKGTLNSVYDATYLLALNMAYNVGCNPIYLIGFDLCTQDGKIWGALPEFPDKSVEDAIKENPNFIDESVKKYQEQKKYIGLIAAQLKGEGIRVVNCSRISQVDDFEKGELM